MRRGAAGALAFVLAACLAPVGAADPWPAESARAAQNLTSVEGPAPNDFYVDLSGAFWNAQQQRLWVCRNGGTTGSKFWALVPDGAGSFQVEFRAGHRGEWTNFGDLEDITQVDLDADLLYALIEGEERIKAYDVSTYGTAVLKRNWNVKPFLPLSGGLGAEGLAFVPDRFLAAAGFTGTGGVPTVSQRGMGGLMFVGHQNGGALYVFDLAPDSNAFTFVGEYRTSYDETAALHFDRGNGQLYIWHDENWDTWEVSDLTSTSIPGESARQLHAVRTFQGPDHLNTEGLTLTSIDECVNGSRSAIRTVDGGGADSLDRFSGYTEGCTTLFLGKDTGSGAVQLGWSGGVAPYTLLRARDAWLTDGRTKLLDASPVTAFNDSVLNDGTSYYYMVP
jgi:hypothetical protein